MHGVENVAQSMLSMRSNERLHALWQTMEKTCEDCQLTLPALPRVRKVPKKLEHPSTPSAAHTFLVEEYFRRIFFECIDLVVAELQRRFNQTGYEKLASVETLFLKSVISYDDADSVMLC